MKKSEQKLDELFDRDKSFLEGNSPLLGMDEIRSILETGTVNTTKPKFYRNAKMITAVTAIIVSAIGLWPAPDSEGPPEKTGRRSTTQSAGEIRINTGTTAQIEKTVRNRKSQTSPLPETVNIGDVRHPEPENAGIDATDIRPTQNEEALPEKSLSSAQVKSGSEGKISRTLSPGTVNIEGVRLLELEDTEWEALGVINRYAKGVQFCNRDSKGQQFIICLTTGGTNFQVPGIEETRKFLAMDYIRLITDGQGNRRLSRFDDRKEESAGGSASRLYQVLVPGQDSLAKSAVPEADLNSSLRNRQEHPETKEELGHQSPPKSRKELGNDINAYIRINRLIPFRIITEPASNAVRKNDRWGPDLIVWFEPRPEFIQALPEDLRRQLTEEYAQVGKIVQLQDIRLIENEAPAPGDRYSGVWRTQSGAIRESQLSPNPVTSRTATLRFTLSENRSATIALHTVQGRFVRKLITETNYQAGENTERLGLEGIDPGLYLVSIQTDKGEQAVQRLVVE